MKYYFGLFILVYFSLNTYAANFSIKNGKGFLYRTFNTPATNGDVFVFTEDMENSAILFSVEDSTGFKWYAYTNDPGIAEPLTEGVDYETAPDGKSSLLKTPESNHGYYVEYGDEDCELTDQCVKKYMWIAGYAPIRSVTWEEGAIACSGLSLQVKPQMRYVLADISGYRSEGWIQRKLNIAYFTFKEEEHKPGIHEASEIQSGSASVNLDSTPYVDTDFTITDSLGVKLESDSAVFVTDTFYTSAVIAFPSMIVNNKQKNELDPKDGWETDDFGNVIVYFSEALNEESAAKFRTSAPLSVDLASNASPMVNKYEWHLSKDKNFANEFVYYEKDLNSYVFTEPGMHYIKLVVQNNINLPEEFCNYTSYACLNVSESEILVPNVFTPNGDSKNDEFKVAYKSIQSYHCRIYNQWGRKVYDSTDITKGWDGTIGGTHASIGTYYYVIEAKGTDGKAIKKQGDINLLRSK